MKFYFFKSTFANDEVSGISVFTTNIVRAYKLANKWFKKNNCQGEPVIMTL